MCSQCYKTTTKANNNNNKKTTSSSSTTTQDKPLVVVKSPTISMDDTTIIPAIEKSRKHLRSPSPEGPRILACKSAPTSAIASPAPITDSSTSSPTPNSDKPVQTNKGRCFKCRSKVSIFLTLCKPVCFLLICCYFRFLWLNKQQINVDVVMYFVIVIAILIDMIVILILQNWIEVFTLLLNVVHLLTVHLLLEILAKNNPKLHERPRGGRSFQRIDSL
jgi:hypothetical protein